MAVHPVVIVDYGMGNVGSLRNMLAKVEVQSVVSNDPELVRYAPRVLLPGVGAFDHAMRTLQASGLARALVERSQESEGLLVGVCLGMQVLMDSSEEGQQAGLGLIPGTCRRFPATIGSDRLLVPHMGWNEVRAVRAARLAPALGDSSRFYFVHSYHVVPADPADTIGITSYGIEFVSAVERGSVLGFQFHPEKSHRHGWQLLSAVLGNDGD